MKTTYGTKKLWLLAGTAASVAACLWGIFNDEQEAKAEAYVLETKTEIGEFQTLEAFLSAFGGYSKEQVLFAFPVQKEAEILLALSELEVDWHEQALAEGTLYQSRRQNATASEVAHHLRQNLFTEAEANGAAQILVPEIPAPLGEYGDDLDSFTQALMEKVQSIIAINDMGDPALSATDIADIKMVIGPMLAAKNVTDRYILDWVQTFIEDYAQSLGEAY